MAALVHSAGGDDHSRPGYATFDACGFDYVYDAVTNTVHRLTRESRRILVDFLADYCAGNCRIAGPDGRAGIAGSLGWIGGKSRKRGKRRGASAKRKTCCARLAGSWRSGTGNPGGHAGAREAFTSSKGAIDSSEPTATTGVSRPECRLDPLNQ